MKDLTQGSIPRHVVSLAIPMMFGMLLQTLYFFVDLYFVARLGDAAIAGVSAAGNLMFVVFFLTQMLGVGTVAMVSQAVGRKDQAEANHVFNQAVLIGAVCMVLSLVAGYASADAYMRFFASDEATHQAGLAFLNWFIAGMALQFPMVVMGSGLRGTGIVKPTMAVQVITVVLNTILAPILIAGWGTGKPLGVAGASLATTISIAVGNLFLLAYFIKLEHYVKIDPRQWKPKWSTWMRLFNIGLPAGGEFGLMAIFVGVMYWAARGFGTPAQGGLGIGFRINQMLFVPVLAISFAAAPIVGQNFGAKLWPRVRQTFYATAAYGVGAMVFLVALVQWKAEGMVRIFTSEPAVVSGAVEFLSYTSWNFIPAGIAFSCSAIFQGLGNTWPTFWSSAIRIATFAFPGIWLAGQPGFELHHLYMLSVTTVYIQAGLSYFWLRFELKHRLGRAQAA